MNERDRCEFINDNPQPTDAVSALTHTITVYDHLSDGHRIMTATLGVYGKDVWTGLTLGDLRVIASVLASRDA